MGGWGGGEGWGGGGGGGGGGGRGGGGTCNMPAHRIVCVIQTACAGNIQINAYTKIQILTNICIYIHV